MVLYCSGMMNKYYSCLGLSLIKNNEEGKYIHNEIFNNISHFIKNCLRVNFLQDAFVMYNDKLLICKREVVPPIPDYIILIDLC